MREYRISPTRLRHGWLLVAVLAAIGVGLLLFAGSAVPDGALLGAIVLAFAVAVLVAVTRAARDPRPRMVIDGEGIWYREWGLDKVPWAQVADAYPRGSRLKSMVQIELREPDALLARVPEERRRKLTSNRLVRLPALLVPDGALDAPLAEILAEIRSRLAGGAGSAPSAGPAPR